MEFELHYNNPPRTFKNKIELVKDFKSLLNLGLKEAKEFIEELQESGAAYFTIEGDELPHALTILLHKNNITFEKCVYPNTDKTTSPQNNIIRLNKFSGDILQEMDLKNYLNKQFGLNYIEAAELIEQLKKGESKTFDINPAEKDFISGIFERYGVAHDFDAPLAKMLLESLPNWNDILKTLREMSADLSLCISNKPNATASKVQLMNLLFQYNNENWDLSKSKEKAAELLKKGNIIVKIQNSNFTAFSADVKAFNLDLETYSS